MCKNARTQLNRTAAKFFFNLARLRVVSLAGLFCALNVGQLL